MSFVIPQRLPDFNDHERRQYDNWLHVNRGKRMDPFTYKDKPYYGGVHPTRRKQWYCSKWFLAPIGAVILFYLMHQLVPGTQREFEKEMFRNREALDWDARRERVKEVFESSWKGYVDHAWGKDEYRPISGTGQNMIPDGAISVMSH